MKHYNIPVFISHYGCPHTCVFCNQKKITGRETSIEVSEVDKIIRDYLETLPKDCIIEVAFFGGSFTGIDINLQEDYLKVVKPYIDKGLISGVRLSTRPDYINEEILNLLLKYGVTTIELGVQSFDENVLLESERGHSKEDIYKAIKLIKTYKIKLGIQIMPGLPGSNFESDIFSIRETVKLNPDMVRIYPTLVINETKLLDLYEKDRYRPLSLEAAVFRVVPMLAMLELNNIKVIRVGLQPSEEIREDGVIITGPFHPALRELMETQIYYEFFLNILKETERLEVYMNQKNISRAVGMNKRNVNRLSGKIVIKQENSLNKDIIQINKIIYSREDILKNTLLNREWCL